MAGMSRNFSHVIVWNDPICAPEAVHNNVGGQNIASFSWNNVAKTLNSVVRTLEVIGFFALHLLIFLVVG